MTKTIELWTAQHVAKFMGISEQAVRKALKDGRLVGKKFGHAWMIEADTIRNAVGKNHKPRKK